MDVIYSRILTGSASGLIRVVVALYETGGFPTLIKLRKHVNISHQTCCEYVDLLFELGIVNKIKSEDANMVKVVLTAPGVEFAKLVLQLLKLESSLYAKEKPVRHN